MVVIQFGLFAPADTLAVTRINGKWRKVPLWLWFELEFEGGHQTLLDTWQGGLLKRYYPAQVLHLIDMGIAIPDIEDEVLKGIRKSAKAMERFLAGKLRYGLTALEIQALELEQRCIREHPLLKGRDRYEWIARVMTYKATRFTTDDIRRILSTASDVLRDLYDLEVQETVAKMARDLPELWLEVSNEAA